MKMRTVAIIGVGSAIILAIIVATVVATTIPGADATPAGQSGASLNPLKSVVVLNIGNEKSGASGLLELTQEDPTGPVHVTGNLKGLTANGKHGFHVHQTGNTTQGCGSTGGHFNPNGLDHGSPTDDKRHVGDLGNIQADASGMVQLDIKDPQLSLTGPNSIVGRAFVVHEKEDDLGKGGDEGSRKTGNAGGRIVCGIIAIA